MNVEKEPNLYVCVGAFLFSVGIILCAFAIEW